MIPVQQDVHVYLNYPHLLAAHYHRNPNKLRFRYLKQNMNFDLSILAAICIQNRLALNKKNIIAEDFLRNIANVMNRIKNNN